MSEAIGTFRYRVNLTTTVKEGYRVADATIEFTGSMPGGEAPINEMRKRLRQLIQMGEAEAELANHEREDANKYS